MDLGAAWSEMRVEARSFLTRWLALQVSGIRGDDDAAPITYEADRIIVGPLRFDPEQVELFASLLELAGELFGPDVGVIYLRTYVDVGLEARLLAEASF